jgi:hypothetical protein
VRCQTVAHNLDYRIIDCIDSRSVEHRKIADSFVGRQPKPAHPKKNQFAHDALQHIGSKFQIKVRSEFAPRIRFIALPLRMSSVGQCYNGEHSASGVYILG